jgi:hypothetical protein
MTDVDWASDQAIVENVNGSKQFLGHLLPHLHRDEKEHLENDMRIASEQGGAIQCQAMLNISTYMIRGLTRGMEKGVLNERHSDYIMEVLKKVILNEGFVAKAISRQYDRIQELPNKRADAAKKLLPLVNSLRLDAINILGLRSEPKIQKHGVNIRPAVTEMALKVRDVAVHLYMKFQQATKEVDFYDDEDMDGMVFDSHGNVVSGRGAVRNTGSGNPHRLMDRGSMWKAGMNRRC